VRLALWATPAADGKLPPALLTTYDGPPTAGLLALAQRLADRVRPALHELTAPLAKRPELDLLLLAQHEWRREDRLVETAEGYAAAAANHLARGQALAAKLGRPVAWPAAAEGLDAQRRRWLHTRLRKRDLLLGQPLVTGDPLLLCTRAQPSYSHLVAQYFGWRQRPGGGLFVLELPGVSLRVRDVLGAQLPAGSVLEPSLSFDGRRIAFSFVATPAQPLASTALPVNEEGGEEGYFHLYEVGVDGRGLRQLTSGRYDDLMPCWLPDGALAFVSTRRRGYSRCFGPNFSRRWHSYTLHRLEPGGGEPRILSLNDVSEWFPSLAHDGRLLFARWDYIDRDAVTHQNLWAARPDGTNPVAVWGNALPKPHCTFQARAVPGSPKLAFIASAHHAITGGPLCLLDPRAGANSLAALQRLTPGPLPEAEPGAVGEYYNAPWPLSEDLFLVAYSPERLIFEGQGPNPDHALGIYLLDAAGNRELLYRDPLLGATNPQPLTPRAAPPLLPSSVDPRGSAEGEMVLADVYQGLPGVPRGTVKELRVVQIHPKTTWLANAPKIGIAGEENTRTILGTVPVDPDGSARFVVPAHAAVLFQALDADGCAVQTMRSITWVQPGEQVSCIGCHERQRNAPPAGRVPLALGRPASRLTPGELGGRPFAYAEVVQPVLDKHCVRCHGGPEPKRGIVLTGEPLNGFSRSYLALCGDRASGLVPCFPQRNQVQLTPVGGRHGALGSKLVKMLRAGHQKVVLSPGELRRIVTWIDLNAVFLGSYQSDKAQQSD